MRKLPEFDDLVKMSKEDLEVLRKEYIEEIINSARTEDQKRRLRGLQFKIDMEREKAKNPMDACIKISKMMHDSFVELRDKLKELQSQTISIKNGKIVQDTLPVLEETQEVIEKPKSASVVSINKALREKDD